MAGAVSVRLEVQDATVRNGLASLIASEPDFLLQDASEGGVADLVVLAFDDANPNATFARIQALQKGNIPVELFLTGARADADVLLQALRAGVKEFLRQPIDNDEVSKAFARARERLSERMSGQRRKRARILSVIGGKAGIGTTTVTVNLADCIQQQGPDRAVVLVDLNLRGGDVPTLLDVNPLRGLQDIDSDLARLDETFLSSILTRHESGLYLLPLGEVDLLGGYITSDCVESTFALLRSMFDYVVVDCGHVMDVATQTAVNLSSTLMVVSAVNIPAVRRTKRLLDQLKTMDSGEEEREILLILNDYSTTDDAILADAQRVLGQKPFWTLPLDHDLARNAMNEGTPVARLSPRKELSKSYIKLAARIAQVAGKPKSQSVLGGVFKSLSEKLSRTVPTPSLTS